MPLVRGFRGLLSLLTTLPAGYSSLEDASSVFHLIPWVGFIEGLLLSGIVVLALSTGIGGLLVGVVYVIAHVLLTGGIHLDGFADYSDVLGSRSSGSRALGILKDPRRGSFAMIALVLNLVLSLVAMATIVGHVTGGGLGGYLVLLSVLCLTYVSSAQSMFLVLTLAPPEPYEGMARLFSVKSRSWRARVLNVISFTSALLVSCTLLAYIGVTSTTLAILVYSMVTPVVVALTVARDAYSRLGFANGDVAGFTFELSRVTILFLVAVTLG